MSAPWGYKLTVVAYFEGEPTDAGLDWATGKLNEIWPDAEFMGMAVADVQDEPKDQMAS
jgi:hypothetical protein